MGKEEGGKDDPTHGLGNPLKGLGFLSEAESKKLVDTVFAPERERWKVRYGTLDALQGIAANQSQQSKTLAKLERDTAQNARSQNIVNWIVVALAAIGALTGIVSLLVQYGIIRPLHQ